MLKVYGQVFAQSREGMAAMVEALEDAGFEIAYVNTQNATVIRQEVEEDGEGNSGV